MPARYFTVEEANNLIGEIEPLMNQLLERRSKVVESRHEVAEMLGSQASDVGGQAASQLVQDFIAIERLARKIRSYGCILKDLNVGLVDFLAQRDGREVYLCWRYGEPRVDFFHELHAGFRGRQHI
jgi:hypothetical protein